jgi:hypothetical protein
MAGDVWLCRVLQVSRCEVRAVPGALARNVHTEAPFTILANGSLGFVATIKNCTKC